MIEKKNVSIGKPNKLKGLSNYHVWKLKMKEFFWSENLWEVVEN